MALQRKCFTLANSLPYKLKHPTFSLLCCKQSNNTSNNNNRVCVTSKVSGNLTQKSLISRNCDAFHFVGAIRSKSSVSSYSYNACTRDILRACTVSQPKRHFFTSSCLREMEQQSKEKDTSHKKLDFHEGMALRLVNENGFLSWCRNSYISTVAGLGMINGSETLMAQGAGYGVLIIAGMNMIWGSGSHINNLIRLRKTTNISRPTLILHISGALFHALLYVFLLLIFSGSESKRNSQGQHRKGDFEGRGHPWRDSGELGQQRGGYDTRQQVKTSDATDKL